METAPHTVRVLAGLLTSACLLVACDGGDPAVESQEAPERRTIAGFEGEAIEVPLRPWRIVPSTAAATSWMLALVGSERLAGLPEQAFAYSLSAAALDPAAWEGRTFGRFSAERMLELDPDLVVTGPLQSPEAVSILRGAGIAVLTPPDPSSFEELENVLATLGRASGEEAAANELWRDLERRRRALRARRGDRPSRRVLTYSNLGTGGWTGGRGTTAQLLVQLAGHENVAAEAGLEGYVPIDIERMVELDPDFVVTGASVTDDDFSPTANYLRSEETLAAVPAVRANRIVVLPASLFSSGSHHVVDAAERLAAAIEALEE